MRPESRSVEFDGDTSLDVTLDDADELDAQVRLIKGGGGALLREKIPCRGLAEVRARG